MNKLSLAIAFVAALACQTLYAQNGANPKFVSWPGETYFDFGQEPVRYIENDRVKVGFDLSLGGAIVYLEDKLNKSGNMINSCDWGRQIQLSYYSGPNPYIGPNGEEPVKHWAGLGWNPIQAGDYGGYGSRTIEFRTVPGKSAYVKARPMQWPHIGVLAECLFECEYTLTDNGFELSATIINDRADKTQYSGRNQETPAVYTNAPWYKLVSYLGDKPYENEPVTVIIDKGDGKGWPWVSYRAPEHWTALVNSENYGLGVYQPNSLGTSAGYHGGDATKGQDLGPKHTATGYIAPREVTIIDWNIKRTYKTLFIVGSLDEIRKTVYEHAKKDLAPAPEWVFDTDRHNWTYYNTTDEGFPIKGALKINLKEDAQTVALSPEYFWKTADARKATVELAIDPQDGVKEGEIELWLVPFSPADTVDYISWSEGNIDHNKDREEKQKTRPVLPDVVLKKTIRLDGSRAVAEFDLSEVEGYKGAMRQVKLVFPKGKGKATLYSVRLTQ